MAGNGSRCVLNSECLSGYCNWDTCERPKLHDPCHPGYCPSNAVCEFGFCRPKKTSTDCLSFEYYDNGECKTRKFTGDSCTLSKQCDEEDICLGGRCRTRCRIDDDCFLGEICSSGGCKPGSRPSTTTTTTEKPPAPTSTPTPQQRTTNMNVSKSLGAGVIASIAVGSLILLALLIFAIWGCYRCCCKSTKTKGQVMSAASPIVVQQAPPPAYPSMQSPYMPSSPQSPYVPSSPQPPEYHDQPNSFYQEK